MTESGARRWKLTVTLRDGTTLTEARVIDLATEKEAARILSTHLAWVTGEVWLTIRESSGSIVAVRSQDVVGLALSPE